MKVIAIYTRKSKATDKGESIQTQIKMCEEYIQRLYPEEETKIIYYDEGEGKSGGDSQRVKFRKLMSDAKKHVYNVLMCYRLDRIARSVADFSDLIEELSASKISFISVKEQFDTTTPMGRAMMYIASVFAQLEREIGAERIKDNMRELAKTGRWLGGTTPTGYESEGYETVTIKEINEDNEVERKKKKAFKLKVIESEKLLIEKLFRKYRNFQSLTMMETYTINNDIKTKNNKRFTRFALLGIYQNIVYAVNDMDMYNYLTEKGIEVYAKKEDFDGKHGMIAYNKTRQIKHKAKQRNDMKDWIVAVGKHPGYISGKEWIEVQEIIKRNSQKRYRRPRKNKAILSGILRCKCHGYMRPKLHSGRKYTNGDDRFFYMCEMKELSRSQKCDINNVDGNKLDLELISQMKRWFAPNSKIVKELQRISESEPEENENNDEIERLRKIYKNNEKSLSEYISKIIYVDVDLIDEINKEVKKLKDENKKIQEKIDELTSKNDGMNISVDENEIAKLVLNVINNYFDTFTDLDVLKQRQLLKVFVESAVWDGETVEINLLNTKKDDFFLLIWFREVRIVLSIQRETYVESLAPFSGLKLLIPLIKPIVPIEIKSS